MLTSSATHPPCPRLGVMGCAASPTRVIRPEPNGCPGFSHLGTAITQGWNKLLYSLLNQAWTTSKL